MGDCDRSVRRVSVDNSPTGPQDVLFRPSMFTVTARTRSGGLLRAKGKPRCEAKEATVRALASDAW
jgi:hypothetical protein